MKTVKIDSAPTMCEETDLGKLELSFAGAEDVSALRFDEAVETVVRILRFVGEDGGNK